MERRELAVAVGAGTEHRLRPVEERLELGERPAVAPLVVVGAQPQTTRHALCAEQPPMMRARAAERSSGSVSQRWDIGRARASSMSSGQRPSAKRP